MDKAPVSSSNIASAVKVAEPNTASVTGGRPLSISRKMFLNIGGDMFLETTGVGGDNDMGHTIGDYDKDGDLDLYLLNNSFKAIGSFNHNDNQRLVRDSIGGDKLLRNDGDKFTDVSEEAGIYGSIIGFGLGVTVGDIDQDGWMDIYVSNDFFERDYIYLNNQDCREILQLFCSR